MTSYPQQTLWSPVIQLFQHVLQQQANIAPNERKCCDTLRKILPCNALINYSTDGSYSWQGPGPSDLLSPVNTWCYFIWESNSGLSVIKMHETQSTINPRSLLVDLKSLVKSSPPQQNVKYYLGYLDLYRYSYRKKGDVVLNPTLKMES